MNSFSSFGGRSSFVVEKASPSKAKDEAIGKATDAPVEEPKTFEQLNEELNQIGEQVQQSKLSRATRAEQAAKAEGDVLSTLDPDVREAVGQAQNILKDNPDLKIAGDKPGDEVGAKDELQKLMDEVKNAGGDEELHRVAAACAGRA